MKSFGSLGELAAHLGGLAAEAASHHGHALERAAQLLETDAKDSLGHYQSAAGPFPAWADLTESTQAERAKAGYSPADPLLRSGALRDAIAHEVEGSRAVVGVPETGELSPDGGSSTLAEIAEDMELGTSRAPPRPVFGPTAFRKGEAAAHAAGGELVKLMFGRDLGGAA